MLKLCLGILLLGVIVSGQTTRKPSTTPHVTTKRATTPKPPPLACQYFDMAVKASSKLWNALYANPGSAAHMKLRWDLEAAIHQLYDTVKEFNAFNLINMKKEKDDTAIHFYLIFTKNGTHSKPIEDAVAAGKIGNLAVDKKFLKKECYKAPQPQQYCPNPCSSICMPNCYGDCCSQYPVSYSAPAPTCPAACASTCSWSCPPACCRSGIGHKRGHVKKTHAEEEE